MKFKLSSKKHRFFPHDCFQLSWADIAMFNTLSVLTDPTEPYITRYQKNILGDARLKCLDNAPNLKALVLAVGQEPNIKKWLETRPGNDEEPY